MPPLTYGLISLPMLGGVDTRTEPRSIQAPKLTTLLNGRFGKPGTIRKRQGYSKLAELSMYDAVSGAFFDRAITDAKGFVTLDSTLWLLGNENVYVLNAQRQRWKLAAQAPLVGLTYGPTRGNSEALAVIDTAERVTLPSGIVARMMRVSSTTSGLQVSFYDPSGALVGETFILVGLAFLPKMVAIGSAVLVTYVTGTNLTAVCFDTTALTVGNPLTFTTRTIVADVNAASHAFDLDISGGRLLLAYDTTTANTIKIGYLTPDGQLDGALTSVATAAAPNRVACAVEPSTHTVLVAWTMPSVPRVDGRMYTEALAALFASTALGVSTANGGNVVAKFRSATAAEVFFDTKQVTTWQSTVQRAVVTTAGAVTTSATWLIHSVLGGKPWLMNARVFVPVINDGDTPQTTLFIAASGTIQDPAIIAAAYPGAATVAGVSAGVSRPDVQGSVVALMPLTVVVGQFGSTSAAGEIFIDHAFVPSSVQSGRAAYYTGSALWMLDGRNAVENGFWLYPNNLALSQGAGGAQTLLATYSYQVFYEWFSAVEERWISTFAGAQSITLTGANQTATVTVPTITMTNKVGVNIVIYRTLANGTLFFKTNRAANDKTLQSVAIVDGASDASIQSNELSYVTGGVLDNIAPPACSSIAVGNNRVFVSGLQDPNLIVASKLQGFGTPLNFNDDLTISLPPAGGAPITALMVIRDSLIAFRAERIYVVGGDGPNDVGTLGQFDPPRTVSEDLGCISPASVVKLPVGILFQSKKGIYLLGTDLTLSYVGGDVEAFNEEVITSAVSLPDRHEVRFTLASGKTLLFDYLQASWAVWSIGGVTSALTGGAHVILPSSSGRLLRETDGLYTDDGTPYSMVIESPWMHLAGMQGLQRVRRLLILGDYKGAHLPFVSLAYNYEENYVDRQTWDPSLVVGAQLLGGNGGLLGSGKTLGGNDAAGRAATNVYQYRVFPARPRCEAIKVRIEDMPLAGSAMGESYALSEIAFEVALKGQPFNPGSDRVTS